MRDLKGLRYIARLLAEPAREFDASQLVRLETAGEPSGALDTGFVVIDEAAKESYRRRLTDIEDDIADARADNDIGRVELAELDRKYLVAELRRATGLGGRGPCRPRRCRASTGQRHTLDPICAGSSR